MHASARIWIDRLALQPHPEGGWFREVYRAGDMLPAAALPPRFRGDRACATAIYFLIESGEFSAFHRIRSDELWHFYAGGGLRVHTLDPSGSHDVLRLGRDPEAGELPMAVVRAGLWFAAECAETDSWALVGCTVAPGFDFEDFELADRAALCARYPEQAELIRRLTRTRTSW